jgi:hypothetical protein
MGNSPKVYEIWRRAAKLADLKSRVDKVQAHTERPAWSPRLADLDAAHAYKEPWWVDGPVFGQQAVSTFQLYVGLDKAPLGWLLLTREILDASHSGYTIQWGSGAWEGKSETAITITISAAEAAVRATASMLRETLSQDCIGLVRIGDEMEFVS